MNLRWGYARSHTKFGPDWFSDFEVDKRTDCRQINRQNFRVMFIVYKMRLKLIYIKSIAVSMYRYVSMYPCMDVSTIHSSIYRMYPCMVVYKRWYEYCIREMIDV